MRFRGGSQGCGAMSGQRWSRCFAEWQYGHVGLGQ